MQGIVKGKNSADFMKYTFSIIMFQETCDTICFKLGMMLNISKLQFDSSLNDFDVHSRSHSYGKGRTYVKLHVATQMLVMVDYVRELTEEVL